MDRLSPAKRCYITGRPGPLDRPPLPSGHPISWGSITSGTVLEQSPYPFPIFDLEPQESSQ